ncbi:MAG: hypothetical protein WD557_15125 [Dehalococcoidia bacterium]
MHDLHNYYFAFRVEHELRIARARRLSHLGASLAPDPDFQPAPQPRRRHGWLSGFARSATS